VLFEIIRRRHETRSTMMTSNRPLEDWGKLIVDVPSATAILDRFLAHAEVMTGKSYRLRHQKAPADAAPDDSKPVNALTRSAARRKPNPSTIPPSQLANPNASSDHSTITSGWSQTADGLAGINATNDT
jgi:hypothetical protein